MPGEFKHVASEHLSVGRAWALLCQVPGVNGVHHTRLGGLGNVLGGTGPSCTRSTLPQLAHTGVSRHGLPAFAIPPASGLKETARSPFTT